MFTFAGHNPNVHQAAQQIDPASEGRHQTRTHLFVAATIYADSGSTPVKIRNMSQSGVLIEGAVLPDVGERITLKRGRLHATGWITWRVERKAGVRLEAAVHVADWMARQVSSEQERIDALLSIVRNDKPGASGTPAGTSAAASIEAELAQLRAELGALENALLGDVIVVATHPEIQTFDISLQRIDRILKQLHAGG